MTEPELINKFLENNINLHPDAFEKLRSLDEREIERIINEAKLDKEKPLVITPEYLKKFEKKVVVVRRKRKILAEEYEAEIEIKRDVTKKSYSKGDIEGFVEYFNDRYEKLSRILREREALKEASTIELIREGRFSEVKIIGFVNKKRTSKKGNIILEIEDPTGIILVVIMARDIELTNIAKEIVKDEIIGIAGVAGRNGDIIIAKEIFFPDVKLNAEQHRSEAPISLALISDTHIGSTKFMSNEFEKFIKWINCELGSPKQRELAERIKYLIIGGDLVDGVGIYPNQENELIIKDIHQQYDSLWEYISQIPDYIEIIIIPGNHDATRQAEPQPAISEEFAEKFYQDPRIHMVGNPCYASVHGVKVLTYHGRSLDDIISNIPGNTYNEPDKAMLYLLKKRHLAPIYGDKVPLAPENYDYLLIDEPPDILHTGHIHTVGVDNYRGVTLVNSGTFQEQTSFQKKMNMRPDPAKIPIINLDTFKTTIMRFVS